MMRAIAKQLAPETFADASRYQYLRGELNEAHRWMGEFPDIRALTEWLNANETNHWRKLDEKPVDSPWHWRIDHFREQLRKRRADIPERTSHDDRD